MKDKNSWLSSNVKIMFPEILLPKIVVRNFWKEEEMFW